jgi:hypothetical protein
VLRINKRTITPKALTAGIVAFTIGVAGAGAYVDRMQSFTDYENVAFDETKAADAGVLGASDERQEKKAQNGSATGASSQTSPAMSSTSTVAGSGSGNEVQPATGTTTPTSTYLAPGMGGGSTSGTGTTTSPSGSDTTITDTLTAPLYDSTCVDTCVVPLLPEY